MLKSAKSLTKSIAIAIGLFGFQASVCALPVYDVAADFSFTNNPNGVWQYGNEATLGAALSLYTSKSTHLTGATPDIQSWRTAPNIDPNVSYNPTSGNVTYASTTFLPGHVTLHPGPANQYSVIRFTAPTAGQYLMTGDFNMRSFGGTHSTDVHILLDNDTINQLFSSTVNNFNDVKSFSRTLTLAANDFVDFVVGPNGTVPGQAYLGDTTQLNARLELLPNHVPEPGTVLLTALAIGLMGMRKRGFVG